MAEMAWAHASLVGIKAAQALIDKLLTAWPGSTVKTVDVINQHFPHVEEAHITSFFTPVENHTDRDREAIRHSNEAIRDIMEADILIIGTPMYNFSIHSTLKTWIDHVVRRGVTFSYSEKGVEGLVKGKKVYLVISSGGVFSEGPMKSADFAEPYLRWVLGFIGLTDITVVRVEGTSIPGLMDGALEKAINDIHLN